MFDMAGFKWFLTGTPVYSLKNPPELKLQFTGLKINTLTKLLNLIC